MKTDGECVRPLKLFADVGRDVVRRRAKVSFNDLRRTFSTWMRNAGVSPSNVGAMMGHVNSGMVEQAYDGGRTEALVSRIEADLYTRAPSSTRPNHRFPREKWHAR